MTPPTAEQWALVERLRSLTTRDTAFCNLNEYAVALSAVLALARDRETFCTEYRMKCDRETKAAHVEADRYKRDAERLDFLDQNARFKMGWRVSRAPVGNLDVTTLIQLGGKITSIREAIDAAIAQPGGEK